MHTLPIFCFSGVHFVHAFFTPATWGGQEVKPTAKRSWTGWLSRSSAASKQQPANSAAAAEASAPAAEPRKSGKQGSDQDSGEGGDAGADEGPEAGGKAAGGQVRPALWR